LENLEIIAMRKLLGNVSDQTITNPFNEIRNAEIFETESLMDYGILKRNEHNEVTFCDIGVGIEVFGSSYLIKNCSQQEVVDLIIEMVLDDKEYEILKDDDDFGTENTRILKLIFSDQEFREIYVNRLMKNENNLKRLFLKETKNKSESVTFLILSATEYGEPEIIKKILQETNQKKETCLHKITRTRSFHCTVFHNFLKIVIDKNLVDNFGEWFSKKDLDGKTFLFTNRVPNFKFFKDCKMDQNSVEKLLLEKDNNGETFLFQKYGKDLLEGIMNITNKSFLRELLLSPNNENEKFLITIDKGVEEFLRLEEIVKFIKETFPGDLQLFQSLLNFKNKQGVHFMQKFDIGNYFNKFFSMLYEDEVFTKDELKKNFL
jgi:hypothetical protein